MSSNNKSFILTAKAKLGDVSAQFDLGLSYYIGNDTEKDIEKAVFWLEKASANDNMDAAYYLGCINEFENHDYEEAALFYEKAAYKGHTEAQSALASLYVTGKGVQSDPKKALFWFKLAAEGNDAAAQFYLGEYNCFGRGIPVNIEKAIYWYRQAAEKNHKEARNRLSYIGIDGAEYLKPISRFETESFFLKPIFKNIAGESYSINDIPLEEFLINACQGLTFNMRAHLPFAESQNSSTGEFFLQGTSYMFSKAVEASMLMNFPEEFTFNFKKLFNPEYSSKVLKHTDLIKEAQETGKGTLMYILKEGEKLGIKAFYGNSLWTNDAYSNIKLKNEEAMLIKWIPLLGLAYSKRKGYLGLVY